jgi:hypothetical protein
MKRLCLVLLLCPSIAWGGPKEKKIERVCGEKPDTSVATQTSQEKSGAVEGQARGIGGGSASGSAAGEASYEVLAGREHSEKLMTQWTWCRMKVAGQMSHEVFERRIDQLWGQDTQSQQGQQTPAATEKPQTTLPPKKSRTVKERENAGGGSFSPLPAEELAGSWSVTATSTQSTCGAKTGDQWAYSWLINRDATGKVTVKIQGETSYPSLTGTYEGGQLVVYGLSHAGFYEKNANTMIREGDVYYGKEHYFFSRKWHELQVSAPGKLSGMSVSETMQGAQVDGNRISHRPCTTFWDFNGTKIQ